MKIALIGSRGIPARYGGYETLVENLSVRLQAEGHRVTVYCRSHYTKRHEREHRGVRLVRLPTIRSKHLDTPVHTMLSCLHAMTQRFDVALVVNGANAIFLPLLKMARTPTALHVDGIEKRRAKWGVVGRLVYALSERLACRLPDCLVTDAEVIRRHYLERYGATSRMITYGVDTDGSDPSAKTAVLDELGLENRGYFLYVSRFEPENNPHRVVEAYRQVGGELPLVMVGGAPYSSRFVDELRRNADRRVLFPGAIYGDGYRELMSHAFAYIHATEVGGTHPALVEAMGYGNCLVVNDAPENREVAGDAAMWFEAHRPATLSQALDSLRATDRTVEELRDAARQRAHELFSWARVTDLYVSLFEELATNAGSSDPPRA